MHYGMVFVFLWASFNRMYYARERAAALWLLLISISLRVDCALLFAVSHTDAAHKFTHNGHGCWHGMAWRAVVLWTMQTIAVLGREWSYECLEDKQTKPFRAQHNYMLDWWNSTFSICLKPTHASYNILLLLLLLLCVCVVSSSHSLFHNADGAIVELNETDGWQGRDQ